jgi:hypothetical protein
MAARRPLGIVTPRFLWLYLLGTGGGRAPPLTILMHSLLIWIYRADNEVENRSLEERYGEATLRPRASLARLEESGRGGPRLLV